MVTDEVEISHEFDFFISRLLLKFGFGDGLLETFVPVLRKSLGWDEFAIFDSHSRSVNWSVSFFVDFLINFSNVPGEFVFIVVFVILGNECLKMLRDDFFLLLLVGVEFKGTVEDSTIIESGNNNLVVMMFSGWFHGCTTSHKSAVLIFVLVNTW